jgi:hypothetical protein
MIKLSLYGPQMFLKTFVSLIFYTTLVYYCLLSKAEMVQKSELKCAKIFGEQIKVVSRIK